MRKIIRASEITVTQLEALRSEAGSAGDTDMVRIVDLALESDCEWEQAEALDECARVLQAAIDADSDGEPVKPRRWTCWGSVCHGCEVAHKSEAAAERCHSRHADGCASQGGYSDRRIIEIDDPREATTYDCQRGPREAGQ